MGQLGVVSAPLEGQTATARTKGAGGAHGGKMAAVVVVLLLLWPRSTGSSKRPDSGRRGRGRLHGILDRQDRHHHQDGCR